MLTLFTKGLSIASGLMTDIAPVAKNVGDALGGVLGAIDKEFRSGTWQQFFKFMAATAGPDVKLLGDLFVTLLGDLPPLLEQLQPLAVGLLQVTTGALKLVGGLEKFHLILPVLGAAIGFMVGGPFGALIGAAAGSGVALAGLGGHAEKLTGQIQVTGQHVREVTPQIARFGTSAGSLGDSVQGSASHLQVFTGYVDAAREAFRQAHDPLGTLNDAVTAEAGAADKAWQATGLRTRRGTRSCPRAPAWKPPTSAWPGPWRPCPGPEEGRGQLHRDQRRQPDAAGRFRDPGHRHRECHRPDARRAREDRRPGHRARHPAETRRRQRGAV